MLEKAVKAKAKPQVFACWEGDQELPAESEATVAPSSVAGPYFVLVERQLLSVADDA